MKEIVTVQIGQCGNTLGSAFWEEACLEHGLLPNGLYGGDNMENDLAFVNCMFIPGTLGGGQNFVARSVMVDLDPSSLDTARCSPYGQLLRPDNVVSGSHGSGNNFARGYFTDGRDIQDPALEAIRKEIERCDWPLGFQIFGALGGGCGAGTGSLLLQHMREEYPKHVLTNVCVVPGGGHCSDAVVEPLNATLGAPAIIKHSDLTICLDNQCLYEICQKNLKLEAPTYRDLNEIVAKVVCGLTSTYRFRAKRHVSWRAMKCFMVPSKKLHFFVPGYAPLNSRGVQAYRTFSTQDISYQLLHGVHESIMGPSIHKVRTPFGKYLTALAVYRGYSVWDEDVTQNLMNFQLKYPSQFCDWMPYHFLKGITDVPPKGQKIAATYLANHTGAQRKMWGSVLRKYRGIMRRKAFVHWFYTEGMDDADLNSAEKELADFIEDYKNAETSPPNDWEPMNEEQIYKKCMEEEDVKIIKSHQCSPAAAAAARLNEREREWLSQETPNFGK